MNKVGAKIGNTNGFKKGHKFWLGKDKSEVTKQKISKALLGRKLSEATKAKMSLAKTGSNSPAWKGGISSNKQYRNWQKNLWNKRKKEATGSHTFNEWQELKAKYNWICPCCGKREPIIKLTEDHIIPLSKGGSDNIENIQPLCKSCNCKKLTKTIKYKKI